MASLLSYSKNITSYDLLKTLALILMIIDHIGYYFFPEESTWRFIGRFSAPIWLFLIGYASTQKLEPRLWIGALVLMGGMYLMHAPTIPLNILFTFLIIRLIIHPLMSIGKNQPVFIFALFIILSIFALPSMYIIEYGTASLIFAGLGYIARRHNEFSLTKEQFALLAGYGGALYAVFQGIWFQFSEAEFYILVPFIGLLAIALTFFKPMESKPLTQKSGAGKYLLFVMGRKTLEIYVIHLLIFQFIAMYLRGAF